MTRADPRGADHRDDGSDAEAGRPGPPGPPRPGRGSSGRPSSSSPPMASRGPRCARSTGAAGQSNTGAVQYHFGDRRRPVCWRSSRSTGARASPAATPCSTSTRRTGERRPAGPGRRPGAAAGGQAGRPRGGRAYLRISAEFYGRPVPLDELVPDVGRWTSLHRWHVLLSEAMPVEDRAGRDSRFAAIRFAFGELARRAEAPAPRRPRLHQPPGRPGRGPPGRQALPPDAPGPGHPRPAPRRRPDPLPHRALTAVRCARAEPRRALARL